MEAEGSNVDWIGIVLWADIIRIFRHDVPKPFGSPYLEHRHEVPSLPLLGKKPLLVSLRLFGMSRMRYEEGRIHESLGGRREGARARPPTRRSPASLSSLRSADAFGQNRFSQSPNPNPIDGDGDGAAAD